MWLKFQTRQAATYITTYVVLRKQVFNQTIMYTQWLIVRNPYFMENLWRLPPAESGNQSLLFTTGSLDDRYTAHHTEQYAGQYAGQKTGQLVHLTTTMTHDSNQNDKIESLHTHTHIHHLWNTHTHTLYMEHTQAYTCVGFDKHRCFICLHSIVSNQLYPCHFP